MKTLYVIFIGVVFSGTLILLYALFTGVSQP